jgi:hypothetical protein
VASGKQCGYFGKKGILYALHFKADRMKSQHPIRESPVGRKGNVENSPAVEAFW